MRVNKEAKMSNFSFNLESNDYKNSNIRESQKLLGQGTPSYVTPITKQKCKKNTCRQEIIRLKHGLSISHTSIILRKVLCRIL